MLYNLEFELKKNLKKVIAVRKDYIRTIEPLKVITKRNKNKLDETIHTIYSGIAPELLVQIFLKLEVAVACEDLLDIDAIIAYEILNRYGRLLDINSAFFNSKYQAEVLKLNDELSFFAEESQRAIQLLKEGL